MATVVTVLFVVAGLINLVPVVGVISAGHIERLYGIRSTDRNLLVLLRHRAVLLGLLGAFLMLAGFCASLQTVAGVAGLVSMASFVILAPPSAPLSDDIRKVTRADILALALLIAAMAMKPFA
ncbi:MAG: phosphopantetheine adenylyltransferase [Deltaproteobacteria bacterium]|nr:phosphopantetheine adenylyltransferase [Deltaproteobacteria bacterium]